MTMHIQAHCQAWLLACRWRGWLWSGHASKALLALDDWLLLATSQGRSDLAHAWVTRAHLLAELHRWDEARSQLLTVSQQQPEAMTASIWFNLGFVLEKLKQPAQARDAFRQALSLSPAMDTAWLGLGRVLIQLGDWDGAVAAWSRQVELQPLCPDGLECLIRLHAARGHWAQAVQGLHRLRSFAPRQAMLLESIMAA